MEAKASADDALAVSSGSQPPTSAVHMHGERVDNAVSVSTVRTFDDGTSRQTAASMGRTALAANRLNVAALRRATPIRMWGGKGSGLPCDFCRVLVGPGDVEYEVEAQLDGAVVMLRFHYRCHYAWTGGEEPRVAADRA